jgi:hypothetical protein
MVKKNFVEKFQNVFRDHEASYSEGFEGSFSESKAAGRAIKLIIDLHLVPRLRISGAIHPRAFMSS